MFARIVSFVLIGVSAAGAADMPPKVSLSIPEAFNFRVSTKQVRKGHVIVAEPEYARMTALASFTEYSGCDRECSKDLERWHGWTLRVYRGASQRVLSAYAKAKDWFEANLNECPEFLGCGDESQVFARFERKRFRWGNAVSFLSGFTQDAALFVPHNGHLQYEVWGVTSDHGYTVVASVFVSHRKLPNWFSSPDEVRKAPSVRALKKEKHYRLAERCRADEFEPSLKAFDRLVDNLSFEETSNQAMQRTASKGATDAARVCHPRVGCVERFTGLAVADLVSR